FIAQVGNYLQYFDWQWARSVAGPDPLFGGLRPLFTLLFGALGAYGAWAHYRKDRTSWAFVGILFLTLSVGLTFYLNFKYGYSYAKDRFPAMEMHEVRERDYFFIVGFSVWGLWAGLGIAALWQRLADAVSARLDAARGDDALAGMRRAQLVAAPVLALALIPLVFNWTWASRAHDYAARDWAYNLLMSVEPYGVLFTNGDNDTFPLWYLQEVEGIRRDVTVIVMSYLNTPWYVKQLRQLTTPCEGDLSADRDPTRIICQRPFVPEQGAGLYEVADPSAADRPRQAALLPAPGLRPLTRYIIPHYDEHDVYTSRPRASPRDRRRAGPGRGGPARPGSAPARARPAPAHAIHHPALGRADRSDRGHGAVPHAGNAHVRGRRDRVHDPARHDHAPGGHLPRVHHHRGDRGPADLLRDHDAGVRRAEPVAVPDPAGRRVQAEQRPGGPGLAAGRRRAATKPVHADL